MSSADANARKALSEPSFAWRMIPNIASPSFRLHRRRPRWSARLLVLLVLREQVARQVKAIGDDRRDYSAPNHRGHEGRILPLVNDAVGQPEQRRDGSE